MSIQLRGGLSAQQAYVDNSHQVPAFSSDDSVEGGKTEVNSSSGLSSPNQQEKEQTKDTQSSPYQDKVTLSKQAKSYEWLSEKINIHQLSPQEFLSLPKTLVDSGLLQTHDLMKGANLAQQLQSQKGIENINGIDMLNTLKTNSMKDGAPVETVRHLSKMMTIVKNLEAYQQQKQAQMQPEEG